MDDSVSEERLQTIAQWLAEARRVVAFTGAGISTESGIPDFRSPGGVWATNQPVYYDDFLRSADARYEYWRQKAIAHRDFADAQPNAGHHVLAKWEGCQKLTAVITQNIDGLHHVAGSEHVLELHGTARQVACLDCHARQEAGLMVEQFLAEDSPPACPECGGLTKHATVSFGQSLESEVLEASMDLARQSDLFFAMGSSLVVQPAASLPLVGKHSRSRLVIINRDPTPLDEVADEVIHASIGETLTAIDSCLSNPG
jgi:NAD-dependent deacetylase